MKLYSPLDNSEEHHEQQPAAVEKDEVKEDVDDVKPEELQMKVDPESVQFEKKRKFDEILSDKSDSSLKSKTKKLRTKKKLSQLTNQVEFDCDYCDYVGADSANLQRHEETEHGQLCDKQYPCDQCDYIGETRRNVKEHQAATHGRTKYYCDQCDFVTLDQYR